MIPLFFRHLFLFCLVSSLTIAASWAANQNSVLTMSAAIANKGLGCEIVLPQSVLQFIPLQANTLEGAPRALQIQPLLVRLTCVDEKEALSPLLTLTGETPYETDTQQVIFLDGEPNGVGFMVRYSEHDTPIPLSDFYSPDAAIGNQDLGQALTILDENNHYQQETRLWVGLIGPLQPNIIFGRFQASLTINVEFQ